MAEEIKLKSSIKSLWTSPRSEETGAPPERIVHARFLKFGTRPEALRIGVGFALGYFKCGSETAVDWVTEFTVSRWTETGFEEVLHITGISKPASQEEITWYDVPGGSSAYVLCVRRSGIDGWWPCYNLAETAFRVEAVGRNIESGHPQRRLHKVLVTDDDKLLEQEGLTVKRTSTEVRFDSPRYSIGFRLKSAGLSFLGLDGEGSGRTSENLLAMGAMLFLGDNDFFTQGPVFERPDAPADCGYLAYQADGETELRGNTVIYRLRHEPWGLSTELRFTMKQGSVELSIKRSAEKTVTLLSSTPFRIAFDSRKMPLTALGHVRKEGETGSLDMPLTLHLPGYASIRLEGGKGIKGRFNSIRPHYLNTFAFELGETPCSDGTFRIEKGEYRDAVTLHVGNEQPIPLKEDTPKAVRQAFGRYLYTSLPYRADTATFSNNGNSMGAPICLELWAELTAAIGKGPWGVDTVEFLKNTIEIHLMGAPAYAAGRHYTGEFDYEDEYLMTGTSVLLGIGRYLEMDGTGEWFTRFREPILQKLDAMKARDIDGDGLVESTRRRGNSGQHQWSSCWYDVISYGYKDAFSNAILYPALRILSRKLQEYGEISRSAELAIWADKLKETYAAEFLTPKGWLAGWKSQDGAKHDYGFLAVNGAAVTLGLVDGAEARDIMKRLWQALLDTGYDSFDMGLPGNLYDIDNGDMAQAQLDLPFGGYQNGGVTISQTRHFIGALYTVGMQEEADFLLNEICKGLLLGNVIGGVGSGCDWKTWDGVYSGYEGLLCDQLGVFQRLIQRYAERG